MQEVKRYRVFGANNKSVLYLTCYAIDKMKMDELMVKQWKRTH